MLATTSTELKLIDCDKWNVVLSYGKIKECIKDVNWSDDGQFVLQTSVEQGVQILKVSEEKIQHFQDTIFKDTPTCATFYRDSSRYLATGSTSGKIYIWDAKLKKISKTLTSTNKSAVKCLDLNSKNTSIVCAMNNGEAILYNLQPISRTTIKIPENISLLKYQNETKAMLGIASKEGSILLRDLNKFKDKMFLKMAHSAPITGITFSPVDKDIMVSSSYDKKSHIYDMRTQTKVNTIESEQFLSCIDVNVNSHIAIGTKNGEILLYDLRNCEKPFQVLKKHSTMISKVSFQKIIHKNTVIDAIQKEISKITPTDVLTAEISDLPNNSDIISDTISQHQSEIVITDSENLTKLTPVLTSVNNENNEIEKCDEVINSTMNENYIISSENISSKQPTESIHLPQNNLTEMIDSNSNFVLKDQMKNLISDQIKDLKDYIKFQTYEILFDTRNNFWNMISERVKQTLFFEDQFTSLHQSLQKIEQTLQMIDEENKKIHTEVEMIKAQKSERL